MKLYHLTILVFLVIFFFGVGCRKFVIDYDKNTFVKDSESFRYVSGSIHLYRVPKDLWYDRLTKMWAAGLNAIETYVFWNEHEPYPGVYDFEGQNDIFSFIEMAHKIGFLVILRPGPYVCAEHEFGGLPWWLLSNGTENIILRSHETNYMNAVERWFNVLLPKVVPHLYINNGSIISVQIENEYGFFYTCDSVYKTRLRDLFRRHLGNDVVYFTTDPYNVDVLKCGTIPGVYATVDFGTDADVNNSFAIQRQFSPIGPLVNSEFYPGWLDNWGKPHAKVSTEKIVDKFYQMMDLGANVNFYMFHGGTNFGFSTGADPPFIVYPTSYDYDAPISEAGDITDKYLAIRNAISKYLPLPNVPIPANSTKTSYGTIQMNYHVPLVDTILSYSNSCQKSVYPQSFEKLGQGYGFILYYTTLDDTEVNGKILSIPGVRDRGYVQIGSASVGIVYRINQTELKINLPGNKDNKLYIIVENMGRLNFGNDLFDSKGLLLNITLDGRILKNWTTCLTSNFVPNFQAKLNHDSHFGFSQDQEKVKNEKVDFKAPAVYIGEFLVPDNAYDTFLKIDKFTKGLAFILTNDTFTNLGRYWPAVGPQITLYVPGVFTKPSSKNYVILFEFEGSLCQSAANCTVDLIDYPIIDSLK